MQLGINECTGKIRDEGTHDGRHELLDTEDSRWTESSPKHQAGTPGDLGPPVGWDSYQSRGETPKLIFFKCRP